MQINLETRQKPIEMRLFPGLKGYCHPARFNAMSKAGKIPQELLDALPPAASYEAAYFPTLEEVDANKKAVTEGWDSVVGANVQ